MYSLAARLARRPHFLGANYAKLDIRDAKRALQSAHATLRDASFFASLWYDE